MMMQRLGIMGGTFDPIHYGHLVTAETIRQQFRLSKVLFIPSGQPPHKNSQEISSPEDRFQMTCLAIQSNPAFFPSRIEIDRQGYTYTVDTIQQLQKDDPETELYFITGADAFQEILSWKTPEKLLSFCHFVVATRPGYKIPEDSMIKKFIEDHWEHIHFQEVPALDISSSVLRSKVRSGQSIRYLLPDAVEEYIQANGLYHE